jgi:GntR family transcriptional regulator
VAIRELGQVDKTSHAPAFKQIATALREAIGSGRIAPGDKVPSETQRREHFGVARMTNRQALGELSAEGLLVAERGRGVFVRERHVVRRVASDRFARRDREAGQAAFIAEAEGVGVSSVDEIQVGNEVASSDVRETLSLPVRARVVARRRRYLMGGHPVELASSYVPLSIAKGTPIEQADTGPEGIAGEGPTRPRGAGC